MHHEGVMCIQELLYSKPACELVPTAAEALVTPPSRLNMLSTFGQQQQLVGREGLPEDLPQLSKGNADYMSRSIRQHRMVNIPALMVSCFRAKLPWPELVRKADMTARTWPASMLPSSPVSRQHANLLAVPDIAW